MSDKKTNIWEHQTVEKAKVKNEKGGGEKITIEEYGVSIKEMYARMIADGTIGSTVAHATASAHIDETKALAMLKNAAKAPQYMEQSEKWGLLQRAEKMKKNKENEEKLALINENIDKIVKQKLNDLGVDNETI